ncbi:hypothetical protein ACFLW2_03285 [Chloroflexota bacterium]
MRRIKNTRVTKILSCLLFAITLLVLSTSLAVAIEESDEEEFRVGPTVRLRPLCDEITSSQDGLIEVYLKNPAVNDITLHFDVDVSVPSGMHVYGEGFGTAAAAGTVSAQFDVAPGLERTVYVNVKAEQLGDFFIHFSGYYWPGDDKDDWRPVSLTYPVTVKHTSPAPLDPEPTNPQQITEQAEPQTESGGGDPWWKNPVWLIPVIIAFTACILSFVKLVIMLRRRPQGA